MFGLPPGVYDEPYLMPDAEDELVCDRVSWRASWFELEFVWVLLLLFLWRELWSRESSRLLVFPPPPL